MNKEYADNARHIATDARTHLDSEYGKYRMRILDEMMAGALSAASNPTVKYPRAYIARYNALKEIRESYESDLGNDTPTASK